LQAHILLNFASSYFTKFCKLIFY